MPTLKQLTEDDFKIQLHPEIDYKTGEWTEISIYLIPHHHALSNLVTSFTPEQLREEYPAVPSLDQLPTHPALRRIVEEGIETINYNIVQLVLDLQVPTS